MSNRRKADMPAAPTRPQVVQPQPVPISVVVDVARGGGQSAVVLSVLSPTGTGVYFLPPDFAEQIAGMLTDRARQARSGLLVAPAGAALPPPPAGGTR